MLIEFQMSNFRSFKDTQTLSMAAAGFREHQETNTFDSGLKGFPRFVRSAAVYGPNAAGKTNLIRGLAFMQSQVLHSAAETSRLQIPYTPFKFSAETSNAPSQFQVTLTQNNSRYEYGFALSAERIEKEWLIEYVHSRGRKLFERSYDKKKKEFKWKFGEFFKGQAATWSKSTRENALFLSTAIQLNSEQLRPVFEWFQKRLVTVFGATTMNPALTLNLLDEPNGKDRVLPFLQEADLNITGVNIRREPVPAGARLLPGNTIIEHLPSGTQNIVMVAFAHHSIDGSKKDVALDWQEESSGTQVLFRSAGAWLNVVKNGEVLLFDELDTSLHPLLTRFLVQRFHSEKTNPNNAQLIFTTHNTSLLHQDIFRRDQIWFVDKERGGASRLYPLTEFNTRNDEALERQYMRGRYGALPILDQNKM
jgi:uncharacterized protein